MSDGKTMITMEEAIQFYKKLDCNLVPIWRGDKRKTDGWKIYETQKYNDTFKDAVALAIIGGITSGYLVLVDIDVKGKKYFDTPFEALKQVFPDYLKLKDETIIIKTPSGGWHIYLRIPGVEIGTKKYKLENFDVEIRCRGSYTLTPPSPASTDPEYKKHTKFANYEFFSNPDKILEVDLHYIEEIKNRLNIADSDKGYTLWDIWNGIDEGHRDDGTFELGMALLDNGRYDFDQVSKKLLEVNKRHNPPMVDSQINKIVESCKTTMIRKAKPLGNKKMNMFNPKILQNNSIYNERSSDTSRKKYTYDEDSDFSWLAIAKILKKYIKKGVVSTVDNGEVFCVVSEVTDAMKKTINIVSTAAEEWAIRVILYHSKETGVSFHIDHVKQALTSIKAVLAQERNREEVHNRIAYRNEHIYIDMARPDWKIIKLSKDGWDMIDYDEHCPMFQRFQHQGEITEPIPWDKETDYMEQLAVLLRINQDDKLMFKILVTSFLLSGFPVLILILIGEQGSAKSTITKAVLDLIDPSGQHTGVMPEKLEDMILRLYSHYLCGFENVSYISQEQSDVMCASITGAGHETRKFYTNKELAILSFRRKIILNGITPNLEYPDLRDRTLIINIEKIDKRITERRFWKKFNALKPLVFGQMLDMLQKASQMYFAVDEELDSDENELPRMADFAIWGEAISRAMGNEKMVFLNDYKQHIKKDRENLIESFPLIRVIENDVLNDDRNNVSISFHDLLVKVKLRFGEKENSLKKNKLPVYERSVRPALIKIAPLLRTIGIEYEIQRQNSRKNPDMRIGERYIIFKRTVTNPGL